MTSTWARTGAAFAGGAPIGAAAGIGTSTKTTSQARSAGRLAMAAAPAGASFFQNVNQPDNMFGSSPADRQRRQTEVKNDLDPASVAVMKGLSWLAFPFETVSRYYQTGLRLASQDVEKDRSIAGILKGAYKITAGFMDPEFGDAWEDTYSARASVGQGLDRFSRVIHGDTYEQSYSLLDDPSMYEEKKAYYSTGFQRFTSGTFDFAFNLLADPTIALGKAGSVAKSVRGIVGAETISRAAAAESADVLKGKAKTVRSLWDTIVDATEPGTLTDGTIGGLARSKYFAQTSDGGAIPYLMGRANEMTEFVGQDASRKAFKLDLLAAGAGDLGALERVGQRSAMLRVEIENMAGDLQDAYMARELSKPGADMDSLFEHFNDAPRWIREVEATKPLLSREFEAIERVKQIGYAGGRPVDGATSNRGQLANLPVGAFGDLGAASRDVAHVVKTVQYSRFTTPFHMITGKRIPNSMRLSDPNAPLIFREMLNSAHRSGIFHPKDPILRKLDDEFMAAAALDPTASKAQRGAVIRRFEDAMDQVLAKRYGADLEQVRGFMREVRFKRNKEIQILRGRAYASVAKGEGTVYRTDDGAFALSDDLAAELGAGDAPIMGAQVADYVSMINPKDIVKFMDRHGRDGFAGMVTKTAEGGWAIAESALTFANGLWKFAALFRLAYPMRVQVDTQARLMSELGVLRYAAMASKGVGNTAFNNLARVDSAVADQLGRKFQAYQAMDDIDWRVRTGELNPETAAARRESLQKVIDEAPVEASGKKRRVRGTEMARYLGKPQRITRKGELKGKRDVTKSYVSTDDLERQRSFFDARPSIVGMMTDGEQTSTRNLRATGEWLHVPGTDKRWLDGYLRHVNREVRNDPAAKMILAGENDATIIRWLTGTGEGRAYWNALGPHYEGVVDRVGATTTWLTLLRRDIDNLLPDPDSKALALERGYRKDDVQRLFPTPEERPQIPTEDLRQNPASIASIALQGSQEWFFKFAAEIPETMMGRHPFYQSKFEDRMRRMIADSGTDVDKMRLSDINLMRQKAAQLARRDVGKVLFDTSLQTNLGYHMRFLSPFYAAWYDMMSKWSRIMGNHMEVIPLLPKIATSPNRAGLVVDDDGNIIEADGRVLNEQGEVIGTADPLLDGQMILPVPSFITNLTGQSEAVISKRALNVIFQGDPFYLPGPGPLVTVSANEVMLRAFPEVGPTMADSWLGQFLTAGYGLTPETPAEQVQPQWVSNLITAITQNRSEFRFNQAFAMEYQAILTDIDNGRLDEMDLNEIEDLAARKTRNRFIMQLVGSYATPVSVRPRSRMEFYIQKWRNYQREYGLDAYDQFAEDYPEYTEMAISLSMNETGIAPTEEAWRSVQPYRRSMARNPEYGWAFAGADNLAGEFSPDVYTAERAQDITRGSAKTFRRGKTAEEIVRDNAEQRGWADYTSISGQIRLKLEERAAAGGSLSLAANANADLRELRDQFVADLQEENPTWAEDFSSRSTGREAEKFMSWATDQVTDFPELGDRPDFQALAEYMEVRADVQDALLAIGRKTLPTTAAEYQKDPEVQRIQSVWETFVGELIQQDIGFEQMYDRALSGDTLAFKTSADDTTIISRGVW